MTSEPRIVPESSLVDEYLKAAAADHQGHKVLDLAVWYAIIQNYINRRHIQFLGQPFRVHFFVVANSTFGKSSSLDFGFVKFLSAYRRSMGVNDVADPHFIDLSGQNTAAGLIDAFNDGSDPYKYQILTAWIDETTNIFPRYMNRRDQDIANLVGNVFFGRRDVRHVRERGAKKDSVDRPIINACFPATPDQYVDLMKGTSSSDILKRFILLAPTQGDRVATPFTRYRMKLDDAVEKFGQWQNLVDVHSGTPTEPYNIELSKDAFERINKLFLEKSNSVCTDHEKEFFAVKQNSTLFVAALNAVSRSTFEVTVEDVECAWNLLNFSWAGFVALENEQPMDLALTPAQKQRKAVIERIVEVVANAGTKGLSQREIQNRTWALRYFDAEEREEMFGYLEKEVEEIFSLVVDSPYIDGRKHSKRLYFSRTVWSPEEAAQKLPISRPMRSPATKQWVDALGNTHANLADCIGYRPEWDVEVRSSSLAS